MPIAVVTEEQFESSCKGKLGLRYSQALSIFQKYGPLFSVEMTNILFRAANHEKISEVLCKLEDYWLNNLKYQHLAVDDACDCDGIANQDLLRRTNNMFALINSEIL